jgi:hypothetical protein
MSVQTEFRQRLYDAAEAFYYAGVLTSLPFDAANVDAGSFPNAEWAAKAAVTGPDKRNRLGAPPIVNLAFAIELYLKLLIGKQSRGHDLHKLFLVLEKAEPGAAQFLIHNYRHSRGCREDFLAALRPEACAFKRWRYAYEYEFLCSSADTLMALADGCRGAARELCSDLRKVFEQRPAGASQRAAFDSDPSAG